MKKLVAVTMAILLVGLISTAAMAEEKVLFSFEKDTQGWEIPEWALELQDHVAKSIEASKDFAC